MDGLKVLQNLIRFESLSCFKVNYPQYIIESFGVFVSSKYQIKINIAAMKDSFPTLSQIFIDFDSETSEITLKLDFFGNI